MENTPRRTKFN